jgi:hypothetical protein
MRSRTHMQQPRDSLQSRELLRLATCESRGTSLRPVFYCEEFDACVPVAADSAPWTPTRETPRNYRGVGLCADCGTRETCAVPKPEGGIWTCEAYQ